MKDKDDDGWVSQMRKGLLELCVLNALKGDPLYGYQIVKHLIESTHLVVAEGTIYPLLNRLLKEGLLKSELRESDRGPVRKYYHLTPFGREKMTNMNAGWQSLQSAINHMIEE
ncbi:MAG: PadR family transcriptional regulator [Planctomycetes bacterium]|nr:PadR family transcriptional regulator [Planctomycetota bacterium]